MKCTKCSSDIEKSAKYCPECGEKTTVYEDPFAKYRDNSIHNTQISYKDDLNKKNSTIQYVDDSSINRVSTNSDNKSVIGIILAIIAIPLLFFNVIVGATAGVIGFVLTVIGFRYATKGVKVTSLIISIFSLVIVTITTVFMFVSMIPLTLNNGYETTIGNYFKSAFFNGYYSDKIEGYWLSSADELLYFDEDGKYYLYMNYDDLSDNYYTGDYSSQSGYDLGDNDTIFEDDDYYYYTVNTYNNFSVFDDNETDKTLDILKKMIIIKIDKKDYDKMIYFVPDKNLEIELIRY